MDWGLGVLGLVCHLGASMRGDGWVASCLSIGGTQVWSFLTDYSVSHGAEGWRGHLAGEGGIGWGVGSPRSSILVCLPDACGLL